MRALITGAAGQDGWFLADLMSRRGWDFRATSLAVSDFSADHVARAGELGTLDVTNLDAVEAALSEFRPDVIFHLAGLSSVGGSWGNPVGYMTANVVGTCTVLLGAQMAGGSGSGPRVVNAVSGEIFDETAALPFDEATPIDPLNPYGVSKAAAYFLARTFRARGVWASNAILFNHESHLRPATFVTGKIVRGVARVKAGLAREIVLGNLDAKRDWLHAADVAAGMLAMAELDHASDFVIASGESRSVADFVAAAFASVGIDDWQAHVRSDPTLMRATDAPELRGNARKLSAATGWEPQRPFEEWVGEMVALAPLDE